MNYSALVPGPLVLLCLASSNKCITSSNKKLLGRSASLLVTSALLVVPIPTLCTTSI